MPLWQHMAVGMNSLPSELRRLLLMELGVVELGRLGATSKDWQRTSKDPTVWLKLLQQDFPEQTNGMGQTTTSSADQECQEAGRIYSTLYRCLNEARTADVERLCQLLAAVPATDHPQLVATVCCERATQLGDSDPGWQQPLAAQRDPMGPTPTADGIAFNARGGTAAIVAAMRNHGAAVDLQIAACQALRVLTRAAECQDTVLAIGGAGAVVGALTAHVGVAKVQEVGCRAVQNLVFRKDECVAAVIAAGGVEAVVGALRAHPADARVQQFGCVAAFNLSIHALGRAQLRAAGAQQLVRLAAFNHGDHAGVQAKSAKLLRWLNSFDDDDDNY
jgi:hypothetical protein